MRKAEKADVSISAHSADDKPQRETLRLWTPVAPFLVKLLWSPERDEGLEQLSHASWQEWAPQ